jgi:hypothetical protein
MTLGTPLDNRKRQYDGPSPPGLKKVQQISQYADIVRVLAARLVHTGGTHGLAMARPRKHPKTGVYWLRKRVPDDLRAWIRKREEKLTLKTRDPAEAKRLHTAALAAIEQRWANLRVPARKLENSDLHQIAAATCERCVEAGGPPGIVWDTEIADNLWDDSLDVGVGWTEATISQLTGQTLHRSWCRQSGRVCLGFRSQGRR